MARKLTAEIGVNECIGDSLTTINSNFDKLDTAVVTVSALIPTSVTNSEIGFLNGVTSNIQTQLDNGIRGMEVLTNLAHNHASTVRFLRDRPYRQKYFASPARGRSDDCDGARGEGRTDGRAVPPPAPGPGGVRRDPRLPGRHRPGRRR